MTTTTEGDIVVDLEALQARSDTALRIRGAFQRHGPLTIAQAMHLTGIHTESIRHFVKPPYYAMVSTHKSERNWETIWALTAEGNLVGPTPNATPMRNTGEAVQMPPRIRLTRVQQEVLEGIRNGHDTASKLAMLLYSEDIEDTRKYVYKTIYEMRKRGVPIRQERDQYDKRHIMYRIGRMYGESAL